MREVFLSHASKDRAKASRLREVLVAHGISVWFSPTHLVGAQQWQDEIGEALAHCVWFMVLLTPNSARSMWVKRELSYALIEKRYQDHIISSKNAIMDNCPGLCPSSSLSISRRATARDATNFSEFGRNV
jgi:hypothetical protein